VISNVFRDALVPRRDAFNAAVRRARSAGGRVAGPALMRHLQDRVGPAVDAVASVAPEGVGAVVDALLAATIETFARGLAGGTGPRPVVDAAWAALPRFPRPLAADAGRVVRDLVHGALHLDREVPGRAATWLERMGEVGGGLATPDALRALGVVLAWTCGLAHAREAALVAWEALPDAAACAVFDVPGASAPDRSRIRRDLAFRWRVPGASGAPRLTQVGYAGDAAILGGPFLRPPRLQNEGEKTFATDGAGWWRIHADVYGITLRASAAPESSRPNAATFRVEGDGFVWHAGLDDTFPVLAEPASLAMTSDTLAVTTRRSHRVRLVAAVDALA